jgi:hypothetical protein
MKKIIPIIIVFIGFLLSYQNASAQCTPDPDCTDPEGDGQYCPTQFPNAVEDEYYEEVLTIIIPASMQGVDIHHVDLLSIDNIPPGMNFQCQDDDCSFWPTVSKCVNVYGTPDIGSWGTYKLYLSLEVFMDVNGFPVSLGVVEDSSSRVTIESQLHADFNVDYTGGVFCNNYPVEISYVGDATEAATYNWNFGDNATVISGEGQGPYMLEYAFDFIAMDSISLEVLEGPYTSPVYTEIYMVDVCTSISENRDIEYSVYPNPIIDKLYISYYHAFEGKAIIYDLTGKEVYQKALQRSSNQLDLSELQKGIYFLSIISSNSSTTQKIIKK